MNRKFFAVFSMKKIDLHIRNLLLFLPLWLLCLFMAAPCALAGPDQADNAWQRVSSGAPLGLAYSADGRHYVAYLRPLAFTAKQSAPIDNWVCRIRFTLYDTCPPGPGSFIIAPSSIARPMGVSQGRGDWEGYTPAYYDQGAVTDGQTHILKAGWEWFALIDWRVRWMEEKEPRQAANSTLLSLLPANKEQAESIARSLGLLADTPEWLDFKAVLEELKLDRYRLAPSHPGPGEAFDPGKVTVLLRHDVDKSLYGAQIMAFEEALQSIPATFRVNMGSSIYGLTGAGGIFVHRPGALEDLVTFQQLGHTVSCRSDSRAMRDFYDTSFKDWLHAEQRRIRAAGLQRTALSEEYAAPGLRIVSDTQAGANNRLQYILQSLRESKPGDTLELVLHPHIWTTDTPEFDLSLQSTSLRLALSR